MLAPLRWIGDYAEINTDANDLAERMVMTGNGVEDIIYLGQGIENVVVGEIKEIRKHPDADKLVVCMIDAGDEALLQIVTGADNVFEGAFVPVAKAVATLPDGTKIKKGKLRGVMSFGMLCSGQELNLTEADCPGAEADGILILEGSPEPGMDICEFLELSGVVIEFEVGANRPDCLSVMGVAREAAAALETDFKEPEVAYKESTKKTAGIVDVEVKDTDLCPRYIAAAVTDVKIEPSPGWMQKRLIEAGIRPINNIVDITNFVMIETGQPMHAFDASDIRGEKIIVRRAKKNEKMTTLDDKLRTFTEDMLLICDKKGPIGVAGVMGGQNSEIKDTTQTVVFEAAKFMYGNIRQTSRALGLSTESSMRFSKGVDVQTTMFAMKRALTLIDALGAGKVCQGMIDVLNENLSPRIIKTTGAYINGLLGTSISAKVMQQLLARAFISTGVIGDELICTVPSFRGDIEGSAHIAEEVARMYGYDNIPPTDAQLDMRPGNLLRGEVKTDGIKRYLVDTGFMECVTYSFAGKQDYEKLGLKMPKSVALLNPLGDDTAYMRTMLMPQMLKTVAFNLNRKNSELRLFEVGRVYIPKAKEALPEEKSTLALALSGKDVDFFSLKGIVENIVEVTAGVEIVCKRADVSWLHPGISAEFFVANKKIGLMGAVHPEVKKSYEISQDTYVAEINLEELYAKEKGGIKYAALPKYPAAMRDIAVIVDEGMGAGDIMDAIKKAAGKYAENVELFDVYAGKQVGEGKKSVAYSITLRADDRTLKDAEVDGVMEKVIRMLEETYAARLRD